VDRQWLTKGDYEKEQRYLGEVADDKGSDLDGIDVRTRNERRVGVSEGVEA